jgi:hypothetical protein
VINFLSAGRITPSGFVVVSNLSALPCCCPLSSTRFSAAVSIRLRYLILSVRSVNGLTMKITDRKIEDVEASRRRYKFGELEPGQCLELTVSSQAEERTLRSAASHYASNHEITLSVKKIGPSEASERDPARAGESLFGVWRIS